MLRTNRPDLANGSRQIHTVIVTELSRVAEADGWLISLIDWKRSVTCLRELRSIFGEPIADRCFNNLLLSNLVASSELLFQIGSPQRPQGRFHCTQTRIPCQRKFWSLANRRKSLCIKYARQDSNL